MKIEEGKFYKDGYGHVCGPMARNAGGFLPWIDPMYFSYTDEGKMGDRASSGDLVEEVEDPDKTACKEVSMKPKSASEILEKIWSQTTFGHLLNDLAACDDFTWEELAEKTNMPTTIIMDIADGLVGKPSLSEAASIARALGYDEKPFIEKAIDKMLQDACEDFTCKLTHKAPWEV